MSDNEYAKVIAKNLKRIAAEHEKTQADIARDLHIKQGTVSTWMIGTRVPRMDKIDLLCSYFNVNRAEIMEEAPTSHRESVSNDERELLRLFRSLTSDGKIAALERIEEMATSDKWTKEKTDIQAG